MLAPAAPTRRATWPAATAVLLALLAGPPEAGAGGFAVSEQSARGLGSAHAGEVAAAEDASTIFYNPAGLTLLSGTQFVASGFAIIGPHATFRNDGSTLNPAVGGGTLVGGNGGDPAQLSLLPTFFLAHELTSRVRVGLGVSTPFGLADSYEKGWVGRYHALSSKLETVNVNPSLAIRLTDWLSIGGGADIEYAKARLTNNLDLGSVCDIFGAERGIPATFCNALGLRPQRADGFVKVSGDDWNAGYNVGFMYTPSPRTRVGLAYRSYIHHDLGGTASFFLPKQGQILQKVSGALVDTGGHAAVDLPERVSLGAFHELTPHWALLSDITWTHWSRFQSLVFRFDNPKQPPIVQPENWNDAFRYAVGVRWTPRTPWEFRLGTAYDETPVPDAQNRTPRIPDSDRIWLAAGVGFRPFTNLRFDVGYAHLFAPDVASNNRDPVTGHVLRGDYTNLSADIVGVQLTYDFGWPPLGDRVGF
ncbi:MAG TPA: outer membrane protein transport protein [Candidatus Binatia bacterium]|nr:outer membrane protein transport protein [Candidatus Binatia bacterium]